MTKTIQKTIQTLLVALLMTWSATALSEIIVVNDSAELEAYRIKLPSGNTGLLRYSSDTWRINGDTTFYIDYDTPAVSMADLRAATAQVKQVKDIMTVMLVTYDPETRVVVEVVLEQ